MHRAGADAVNQSSKHRCQRGCLSGNVSVSNLESLLITLKLDLVTGPITGDDLAVGELGAEHVDVPL